MSSCISFASDCDFMTRRGFEEIHEFMGSLGLPAGDSFWLFDPSGGDMGLFTHDVDHPGPQHHWLLDQINAGVLDVIHSAGSFGERFNNGFKPQRAQIEKALSYLERHARVPKIWTNHGDTFNVQNIGGAQPSAHHQGDLHGADAYSLDLLLAAGVKYFWLDRLIWRDCHQPYTLTAREKCRDGNEIVTFMRYLSPSIAWSPNGQNFAQQLQLPELRQLSANRQDAIIYTHWGCHHQGHAAHIPVHEALTVESRDALYTFAQHLSDLDIKVARLNDLLEQDQHRSSVEQIQRIGEIVVQNEKDKQDCFYYNQYGKHGLEYFRRRVAGMRVSGARALDAGCGVGQWSFALTEYFDEVCGIELNPDALKYLGQLTDSVRSPRAPRFVSGSIESLPYVDGEFDFIICYGVLFCTNFWQSMSEFSRVLRPGGRAYICINGDGWYEYLIDERFCEKPDEFLLPLAEPLWNALVARVGGPANFDAMFQEILLSEPPDFWANPAKIRARFCEILKPISVAQSQLIRDYSDRVILLISTLARRHFDGRASEESAPFFAKILNKLFAKKEPHLVVEQGLYLPKEGIGSRNRAVTPAEFEEMAKLFGMKLTEYGGDASLSRDSGIVPIYSPAFNGHESVWECFLEKC